MTRLGSLYVQICNAGCTLFQNWKAVFFCNPQRPMLTVVEFGKEGKHTVCNSCIHSEASHIFKTFKLCLLYEILNGDEISSVFKNHILLCSSRATTEDVGTVSIAAICCLSICLSICLSEFLSVPCFWGKKTVHFQHTVTVEC